MFQPFPADLSEPIDGNEAKILGIDLGSTTAKLVLSEPGGHILFQAYQRHQAEVLPTLLSLIEDLKLKCGNPEVYPIFTGSAGMGMAEKTGLEFVQEVVAQSYAARIQRPRCRTLIDIGGEDCKMIFFDEASKPDMRMNGNCAGGTGAFIDQMSALMDVSLARLDELACQSETDHVIASRCGVFAKTDIQNLINTGVPVKEISRSIFKAVACQTVTSLARGKTIGGPVMFTGGPLYYFQALRDALLEAVGLAPGDALLPPLALFYPAYGATLSLNPSHSSAISIDALIKALNNRTGEFGRSSSHPPLFQSQEEYDRWSIKKSAHKIPVIPPDQAVGDSLYLGIDAGSTTTKVVAIDQCRQVLFSYYTGNRGDPVGSVEEGLTALSSELEHRQQPFIVRGGAVTGYGEDLIKAAFALDTGIVETLAHYRAARELDPNVSFILDIGGQDMKAIFVSNGVVQDIEINESCSSGCGSFIENFGESLGYNPSQFGQMACFADSPVDLGSRCTVFMNSSVKQALRQGNDPGDVAAGLAYSVVQNCLHKVLRITDPAHFGENIIVQGGTFKNPAVLKAFEALTGVEVINPNITEFMGAYGAALYAREESTRKMPTSLSLATLITKSGSSTTSNSNCKGCTNNCQIRTLHFSKTRKYYSGNRCERIYSNSGQKLTPGQNVIPEKHKILAAFPYSSPEMVTLSVGIPMVLNNFENYPFWATFFSRIGWRVVRSKIHTHEQVRQSAATVMSDNICFPAKLVHAHILDLLSKDIDRIFYPRVFYETSQYTSSKNHYNCPIVSGYPDVIDSAIDPAAAGIPLDSPTINFNDPDLLNKSLAAYIKPFNISTTVFNLALSEAWKAQQSFRESVRNVGQQILAEAQEKREPIVVIGGRPYHADPLINHGIPEMISGMGMHVLTEDSLPLVTTEEDGPLQVADQWEYSNRLYRAARWVGSEPLAEFVQFNSFGCGPDAVVIDELKEILKAYSKTPAILKIDEFTSIGSARLRVRSLLESRSPAQSQPIVKPRKSLPVFESEDRNRTLLFVDFSPFYSLFAQTAFTPMGYRVKILPPPDQDSIRLGLRYANNDICFPAIITIGDVLKALATGEYDPKSIAVAFTETGGQCRATNYVALVKKALLKAGYENIPVISVSFNSTSTNEQPGFLFNRAKLISLILSSLIVVDQLIRMYHATAVREKNSGESLSVLEKHLDKARKHVGNWTLTQRRRLLKEAIADFNSIATHAHVYPKAGLVGEIYVKYNPFSNSNIVLRLMNSGIEVVVPPLATFFLQTFVNVPFNHRHHIERVGLVDLTLRALLHRLVGNKIRQINGLMAHFRHTLEPLFLPEVLGAKASRVISLANQAGEGWLLPGEIIAMAESGVRNIVSLQPFGCIANHVVAKGISTKLSRLFPDLNLLNLDMDAGSSDVNIQNRLNFFIHTAKAQSESSIPRL